MGSREFFAQQFPECRDCSKFVTKLPLAPICDHSSVSLGSKMELVLVWRRLRALLRNHLVCRVEVFA